MFLFEYNVKRNRILIKDKSHFIILREIYMEEE